MSCRHLSKGPCDAEEASSNTLCFLLFQLLKTSLHLSPPSRLTATVSSQGKGSDSHLSVRTQGQGVTQFFTASSTKPDDTIRGLREPEAGMFWETMAPSSHLTSLLAQDSRGRAAAQASWVSK